MVNLLTLDGKSRYFGKLQQISGNSNIIISPQVQKCVDLGEEFRIDKIPVSQYTLKSVGVDFGFSSSSTAIVTLEHIKVDRHIIRVVGSHLINKGNPNEIVDLCWDIWKKYNFMNTIYFCDGSNRALINLLKIRWQESLYGEKTKDFGHISNIKIRPVNFSTDHKNMSSIYTQ